MTPADLAPVTTITTVVTRVRDRAVEMPARVALREKDLGIWQEVTWAQYWDRVLDVAHGLLALGVEPGDRVAIDSENRREWLYSDLGIVAVRGITTGLYPTNPPPEIAYLLADSGSKILIAEDQEQVDKALGVLEQAPSLERIIYLEPRGIRHRYDNDKLLSWDEFCKLGRTHRAAHPGVVERRMAQASPDDLMTLSYTPGTTGSPKGVMLSVANVEFAIEALIYQGGFTSPPPTPADVVLSCLPLCHITERIFTTWFNAAAGVQVNFPESIETVQANLREIQPTVLFGVPRIWEKVLTGVTVRAANASPAKRAAYRFSMRLADRIGGTLERTGGRHTTSTRMLYAVGWVLLFRALRDRIGMRKVRYAASGAAPIGPEVLRFFLGLGVPMHEVYGTTENTAIATANRPGRVKIGTVGEPHAGIELRIDDATGEILTRHGGTFVGYWRQPEATAMAIDENRWLHTGDVGEWVDGTHVKITGRRGDIISTPADRQISPVEIENHLKASPYIKEAVVVGDDRPFLGALIGIELTTVRDWAHRQRIASTTYRGLSERLETKQLVQDIIDQVNAGRTPVEQIATFRLLPKDLDHDDGELTAMQEVKRAVLVQRFGDLVESMYPGGGR